MLKGSINRLLLVVIMLLALGCGYKTPKVVKNDYTKIQSVKIGQGRTVNIVSFTSSYDNEKNLEKTFGKSLLTIAQSEFSNSGFNVVERNEMESVVEEHIFSKQMTNVPLKTKMIPAKYNVYIKIVNMQISSGGIWIPIIYTDADFYVETSLEVKLVDNETGVIKIKNGNAVTSKNEKNFLLLFGDLGVNINNAVEFSLRNAIRDALSQF
ncbi:hypothetical protein NON08_12800 [Cetobacterium somerae]|uniref:hypothetical protein n=1 Tax=Cetobacterium sp. NK01 TaxID=2993530 RepID=UPI002115D5B5|nr:hypothetical protein [Cetobacterium sp. NK01]MCQ8213380.1 hypothetical protein [Cetobacterium sp. NK01]